MTDFAALAAQFEEDTEAFNAWLTGPASGAGSTVTVGAVEVPTLQKIAGNFNGDYTAVADVNKTVAATDGVIAYTSLTATRTVTLPAASSFLPGQRLIIVDKSGSASGSVKIRVAPNGSDTIAGSNTTQDCITIPRGRCWLVSNGSNSWDVLVWSVVLTHTLAADVPIDNSGNYFDGPSVAQGTVGTWRAAGTIYAGDSAASVNIVTKLWDGTTEKVTGNNVTGGAGGYRSVSLQGVINAPAGNIRMSVRTFTATGVIKANSMGFNCDSQITVERIA